jgi:hypothetical protein
MLLWWLACRNRVPLCRDQQDQNQRGRLYRQAPPPHRSFKLRDGTQVRAIDTAISSDTTSLGRLYIENAINQDIAQYYGHNSAN